MIDPTNGDDLMPGQVPFDRAEYARRWRAVQDRLAEADLDALLVTSPDNVLYLTGYQTFGVAQQFLVVPATPGNEPVFVLRSLETALVEYTTWVREARSVLDHEDPVQVVLEVVTGLAGDRARLGYEAASPSLPVAVFHRLQAGGTLDLVPADEHVHWVRRIKSDAEIAHCRHAARLTDLGMQAAFEAVADGASENDVAAAAAHTMIAAGSEWFGEQPIVTSGPRGGIPHTTAARRPLRAGDAVLIELSASYHRHFGPLMRSASVGTPSDQVVSMYDACRAALEAAMATIRPGITSGDAHAACEDVIAEHGYTDWFRKRLGYAAGLGLTSWNEGHVIDLKADDDRVLEAGMIFHMPPALRDPGRIGVGLSETVVVTADGCEPLGSLDRSLYIA